MIPSRRSSLETAKTSAPRAGQSEDRHNHSVPVPLEAEFWRDLRRRERAVNAIATEPQRHLPFFRRPELPVGLGRNLWEELVSVVPIRRVRVDVAVTDCERQERADVVVVGVSCRAESSRSAESVWSARYSP